MTFVQGLIVANVLCILFNVGGMTFRLRPPSMRVLVAIWIGVVVVVESIAFLTFTHS